ncbi:MAG: phage holin family protein [Tunicatimonas sp.]|uniref:phage holin family protein n=1 Tax=Tunicatimonas sp. TaxID=1940096 RepID=UPI003C76D2A0
MSLIVKWLLSAIAVMITAYLLPGVSVASFWAALIVAVILALFNTFLKPILVILTIPITVLSLGLFLLVINAIIILLTDALIAGFAVSNFWWALAFSIIMAILSSLFNDIAERI